MVFLVAPDVWSLKSNLWPGSPRAGCEDFIRRRTHAAERSRLLHPSTRAGRNSKARTSANTASSVIPINRNGKDKSQTIGKRIRASSATGQHSTNRMHHPTKRIRAFIHLSFHFCVERQLKQAR